jgi:iron complex outermembrane receptor protein
MRSPFASNIKYLRMKGKELHMKKNATAAALAIAGMAIGAASAQNSADNAVELPAVTVEASRLGKTPLEIPSRVDVIGKGDIDSSGAVSTVDLLEKRANVFFRKMNANPALAQVSMRGYGANGFGRVKIAVDGEVLNNPDMAAQDLLRIPLRSIEKVEILHGPQTVLHGGDASAGIINIITDGDLEDGVKTVAEVHGGSWDSIGTHFGSKGSLKDEGVSYYAAFDWDRSDGWRQNGWHEIWSLKGGFKQVFENDSWVGAKAFWSDSQYGLPEGLYTGISSWGQDYGDWRDDPRKSSGKETARNWVYGASLSAEGVIDDENRLSGAFSVRRRKSTGYSVYEVDTLATDLKYVNESAIGGFENEFAVGGEAKLDMVDCRAAAVNDYERFSGAVFLRDEFFLLEELSFFAGARGAAFLVRDSYRMNAVHGTDSDGSGVAGGETGFNFRPSDDFRMFVRWAPFYHAPLADEMFSSYGVPNLSLRPERGHSAEAGTDWTLMEEFRFSFTAYASRLSDEIAYLNYANVNLDDETMRNGFELSLGWSREKTGSAGMLYSYTEAKLASGENKGNLVPLVPRQQLRLFGEVFLHEEFALNGGMRFVGEQRYGGDFAGKGGMLADYVIFDAGMRYMPQWRWLEGFVFSMAVDNLFDRRYCDYGEYFDPWYVYPAAGRSFMFAVRYEF